MRFNIDQIVSDVNGYENNDWEETTREERHWMQVARDLAIELGNTQDALADTFRELGRRVPGD